MNQNTGILRYFQKSYSIIQSLNPSIIKSRGGVIVRNLKNKLVKSLTKSVKSKP